MKIYRYLVLAALIPVLVLISGSTTLEERVDVDSEYLTDSTGYKYGANFFLNSTVNEQVYASPYITVQENVYGTVTGGPVLLEPNESHFPIGSFISKDHSKSWYVRVEATWQRAN